MKRTYIEQVRAALLAALGENEQAWDNDRPLLDLYTLLVLTRGMDCTCEDIHDAWAIARQRTRPEHPALVPFGELTPNVQAYDVLFRDAVHQAASRVREAARRG